MIGLCGLGGALLRSVPQRMCERILNASAVCIVQSMIAAAPSVRTGWCQGPALGQNQGALRCKPWCSGACKNKGFVVRAPRNFGNFLCPACQRAGHMPAAGGQTPSTPRWGWCRRRVVKKSVCITIPPRTARVTVCTLCCPVVPHVVARHNNGDARF